MKQLPENTEPETPTDRVICTDGSQHTEHGGWAFVVEENGSRSMRVSGYAPSADSYEMELKAIFHALQQVDGNATLICDHQGIVQEMQYILDGTGLSDKHRYGRRGDLWGQVEKLLTERQHTIEVKFLEGKTLPSQASADGLAGKARRNGNDNSNGNEPLIM